MPIDTKKNLEALRELLVERAQSVATEHWARAAEQSKAQNEFIRFGVRVRDERASGRGVRVLWGHIKWLAKEGGSGRRPVFRDISVPQGGAYSKNNFGGAGKSELELILQTETKLVRVRRALKLTGEMLMRLPALDKAVRDTAELDKLRDGPDDVT